MRLRWKFRYRNDDNNDDDNDDDASVLATVFHFGIFHEMWSVLVGTLYRSWPRCEPSFGGVQITRDQEHVTWIRITLLWPFDGIARFVSFRWEMKVWANFSVWATVSISTNNKQSDSKLKSNTALHSIAMHLKQYSSLSACLRKT